MWICAGTWEQQCRTWVLGLTLVWWQHCWTWLSQKENRTLQSVAELHLLQPHLIVHVLCLPSSKQLPPAAHHTFLPSLHPLLPRPPLLAATYITPTPYCIHAGRLPWSRQEESPCALEEHSRSRGVSVRRETVLCLSLTCSIRHSVTCRLSSGLQVTSASTQLYIGNIEIAPVKVGMQRQVY